MLVVGGPGFVDDVQTWVEVLGVNVLITLMLIGLTAHVVAVGFNGWEPYRSLYKHPLRLPVFFALVVLAIFSFVFFANPNTVWTHPTLSLSEQEKIRAECQTQAFEAIGGPENPLAVATNRIARTEYETACLRGYGFIVMPRIEP